MFEIPIVAVETVTAVVVVSESKICRQRPIFNSSRSTRVSDCCLPPCQIRLNKYPTLMNTVKPRFISRSHTSRFIPCAF